MRGDEFTVVIQNITGRKRSEAESNLNNMRLESLLRINSRPAENIQDLLDFALHEAVSLTGSKIGYIYFYSEEKKEFTLNTWSKGVLPLCSVMDQQTVYQLDKTGIWGEAVRQRKAIIINDFAAPNELKKGLPEGHVPLESFLTIPVFSGGEIVATAGVANKEGKYDESDVRQLTLMMDAVWKNVLRRQMEEQLLETKNELEGYFSSSLDLLCIANTSGEFVRLNPQWEATLGYKLEELEGKSFVDYVHPDDLEATLSALPALDAQEEVRSFENRYRRSDGSYRWIEWRSRPVGDTIYAAARDITKRKTAEEKVRSLLDEKELLLKETHHRIKNNLNAVYSLLSMQAGTAENTDSRDIIDDAANRVKVMALL
jgi:PAS domain S-box-containing protein